MREKKKILVGVLFFSSHILRRKKKKKKGHKKKKKMGIQFQRKTLRTIHGSGKFGAKEISMKQKIFYLVGKKNDPRTDPRTDPITDPITDPRTDPITDPITDPMTYPITAEANHTKNFAGKRQKRTSTDFMRDPQAKFTLWDILELTI